MEIWVNPACSKCRAATATLDEAGIAYTVRRYLDDPLVHRVMTASLGAEMLAAAPRTAARAGQVAVPLLMLHGADDPLCLAEGSRSFHAGVDTAGSALRVYPELRHEIFNEPEREAVWQDVQTWLEERSA